MGPNLLTHTLGEPKVYLSIDHTSVKPTTPMKLGFEAKAISGPRTSCTGKDGPN
jgi:hypothetical protein